MCPNCIENICQNRCTRPLKSHPLFGVIWHYEGESPNLFTCEANNIESAVSQLEAHVALLASEAEFYIESVHQIDR